MSALFLLAMLFIALAMGVPVAISLGLVSVSTMLLFADQSFLRPLAGGLIMSPTAIRSPWEQQ